MRTTLRRPFPAFALLFAAGLAFFYAPLLRQPPIADDVGILNALRLGREAPWGASLLLILRRCALPHYFRPLAAPAYWLIYRAWGWDPLPYRLVMLAAIGATSLLVGRAARRAGGGRSAERLAAVLCAFSWARWSEISSLGNMAQSLSDLLFWSAVLVYVGRPRPRALPALALATGALLLKEHAVAWPVFAWAAADPEQRESARRARHREWALAWLGGYALLRLIAPGHDFAQSYHAPRLDVAAALRGSAAVAASLLKSWLAGPAARPPLAETAAAAALGAALAWGVRAPEGDAREAAAPAPAARGFWLAAAAGLLPYLAFPSSLNPFCISRFTLCWEGCAAALGVGGARLLRRSRDAAPRATAALWTLVFGAALARAALLQRRPDPARLEFSRWLMMERTRCLDRTLSSLAGRLRDGGVAFDGFDPDDRLPMRWGLISGAAAGRAADERPPFWRVTGRDAAGCGCVDVRPASGGAWVACPPPG